MKLSLTYRKRTEQALSETKEALYFELDYSKDLQNPERIKDLENHIEKLKKMLS
jgi:hypothetical protein